MNANSYIEIKEFVLNELLTSAIQINSDTSLFKSQTLNSLNLLELISFLEEKYQIKISPMEIVYDNFDTIDNIIAFIEKRNF